LDEETKQLDEYKPKLVQNLKGLAESEYEYEFQLSKKRLAEAEYVIQFSETPPRQNEYSIPGHWMAGQNTEHRTLVLRRR
jgi:hypothetical protein